MVEICSGDETAVAPFLRHNPGGDRPHQINREIFHLFASMPADPAKVVVIPGFRAGQQEKTIQIVAIYIFQLFSRCLLVLKDNKCFDKLNFMFL
jgi:hypothetical protein